MGKADPGATVHILQGQGHFPVLEAPELFNPSSPAPCASPPTSSLSADRYASSLR
jgi:hypothetical protein